MITREELFNYYITENHTKRETWTYFHIGQLSLDRLLTEYNIVKSKELKHELRVKDRDYPWQTINKEEFIKDYQSDMSSKKLREKYNLTTRSYKTCLEKFNLTDKRSCHKKSYQESLRLIKDNLDKYKDIIKTEPIQVVAKEIGISKENLVNIIKELELERISVEIGREKRRKTTLAKYGCNHSSMKNYTDEYKQLYSSRELSIEYLLNNPGTTDELAKRFNCSLNSIYLWSEKLGISEYISNLKSHYEEDLLDFIKSLNVKYIKNDHKVLDGKEIDVYLPDYNFGIEFNGNYWHSDLYKDKYYHRDKSLLAESKGVQLFHIYEYEWNDKVKQDIIKSIIRLKCGLVENRLYARQCEIREITNKEAEQFNNTNHLQGHRNAKITYGLYYNNTLVQLMSFSRNRTYEWEIIRGCPGSNNLVVGGVSKLFKHFVKEHKPTEVFSYCDYNKFTGVGYEKLGMTYLGLTCPDLKYYIKGKVVNRNPRNYEFINGKKEFRIYGAGTKKYLWRQKDE